MIHVKILVQCPTYSRGLIHDNDTAEKRAAGRRARARKIWIMVVPLRKIGNTKRGLG